jgi:hypothetical protein
MYMYTSVGRVSEIFDPCPIQFSQNNLQKGLGFTFSFLIYIYMSRQGINSKNLNLFSQCQFFINLKIINYSLTVLTNQSLPFFQLKQL